MLPEPWNPSLQKFAPEDRPCVYDCSWYFPSGNRHDRDYESGRSHKRIAGSPADREIRDRHGQGFPDSHHKLI